MVPASGLGETVLGAQGPWNRSSNQAEHHVSDNSKRARASAQGRGWQCLSRTLIPLLFLKCWILTEVLLRASS